ncbi:MAG: hypothetical protein DHS20C21_01920 [Gemmatimonadota bacterium]|nr:MAG: hypothetical protein DHS20C21_01920 [Gemmatimonadota bacterium]
MDYERKKHVETERQRGLSRSGRDIGQIPAVVDPDRRAAARENLRVFCDTYLAATFCLPWSPDHLRVLERAQVCVQDGGQFALAMPRGSGKTSIVEAAALWSVLYGHRRFVAIIGASEKHAHELLDSMVSELENNDALAEDFPEVAHPIRALEGIVHRARGQLCRGARTQITWTKSEIVLPTIAGSVSAGAVVRVCGLTGRIRGLKFKRPDGETARPDLVVVDDPQTDGSARSLTQCVTRESILAGAVLGLAGPGSKIAALMPCTVIQPGDVADAILDRKKHPEWNGERTKLIYKIPESKLWDKYAEARAESLRKHGDIREATELYRQHREAMDEGAEVAWPERFNVDELSAIQYAMNLKLQNEATFWAEYQNEPIADDGYGDAGRLTAELIAERVNQHGRGTVPLAASRLTAFIDVQQDLLYWCVVGWGDDFTGYVVSYGAFPDQKRAYFTLTDAQHKLGVLVPGAGVEGAIYAGLEQLTAVLLGSEWSRDDGTPVRIGRCLIDASWGTSTDVVYAFCRQSPFAALLLPSHGRYMGPAMRPITEADKKPGDRIGLHWKIPGAKGKRAVKHVFYDTNFWKSFTHARLSQAMGDPGSLTLYGGNPSEHRMLSEHLTAEARQRVSGSRRTIDIWKLRPGVRDNHLLDCVVGCAVAASIEGAAIAGMEPAGQARKRKRIRLSDLQRMRQAGHR